MDDSLLSPPRGMRDFLPSEALARENLSEILKKTFRKYGFQPLETPALEKYEVLSAKFAGGEEILKETYRLKDQGERELGLRYDLTVPLCRVFASDPSLARPFKRYQIAPVFRDGPMKAGRYREFVQCDVDTIGVKGIAAEAELLELAVNAFKEIGVDAVIKVNNRKALDGLLECCGVPEEKFLPCLLSVDKLEKIGGEGVVKELVDQRGMDKKTAEKLVSTLEKTKDLRALERLVESQKGKEGVGELKQLFSLVKAKNVIFDASLARGLNYYTGMVYEAFAKDSKITSSIASGGRYDDMVGAFAGKTDQIPAVGISFGLDAVMEVLKEKGLAEKSLVQVFVIPIGEELEKALELAKFLRGKEINVLVDLMARSPSKNLDYASKQKIPFAVIIGEKEAKENKALLRDMATGKQELLTKEIIAERLAKSA